MRPSITIGSVDFPLEQYAINGTALLGIRGGGKTYTAKGIAEQLLEHRIPIVVFDPIGQWQYLRRARPGKGGKGFELVVAGGAAPYRTAAECIDWTIPCPSIFDRKKPLAEATMRRIARGVMRYVVDNPRPFIVPITHTGSDRVQPIDEPLRTITTAHRGEFAVVAPTLINTRNGERHGQDPRTRDIERPYGTITAAGSQGALVAAFLARHYGGHENDGSAMEGPMHTVTSRDHHALVASSIVKLKGTSRDGQSMLEPLHTIQAGGQHYGEVRAFLLKYYGTDQDPRLGEPLHTITTKERFGLVTVMIGGEPYAIVDIGMRMLTPRELYRAQGFPDSYDIAPAVEGKPLTKTAQIRMVGNSVAPHVSAALVSANVTEQREELVA